MLERVVDVLVLLPEFLAILDLANDGMSRLIKPTMNLIARLASLWHEYESKVELPSETDPTQGDYRKSTYPDAVTSITVLHFDCARVILMSIFAVVTPDHNSNYASEITRYCESILDCVAFIDNHGIGCAYLRMMLPLVLVYSNSPSAYQRYAAQSMLQKWQSESVMTGVGLIALHTIGTIAGNKGKVQEYKDSPALVV
jgi:hypothetical protein